MKRNLFAGIDPGMSGGIAVLDPHGQIVHLSPMLDTPKDNVEYLREVGPQIQMAFIEKVGAMPGQGISSTAKFMLAYGMFQGFLLALDIPFDHISPVKWQAAIGVPTRGDKTKTEHKNVLKAKAQQLFPEQKMTLAISDALLIAEVCRRMRTAPEAL